MRLLKHAYHHGDLRNALVAEALKLLEKDGTSGFTLRDLARRVGVSCAAPYAHFRDKDALLAAIATAGFHKLTAALEAGVKGNSDPTEQFLQMGLAYVQFGVDNPALYNLMFNTEDLPAKRDQFPELQQAGAGAFQALTGMLGRMQQTGFLRPGDPDADGLAVWAHVHGLASLVITGRINCVEDCAGGRPIEAIEAVRYSLTAMLTGLRAKTA